MSIERRLSGLVWCLGTIALIGAPAAFAQSEAGVVIIADGDVYAVRAGAAPRALQRRAKFFVGDVIAVGETGKAQVRFADGTLLSLGSGTELRIDAFQYSGPAGTEGDSNIVTLIKGGFRTITGAVAKKNPANHQVNTPVATIGVRGTHYSVAVAAETYVGVWDGAVSVKNDAGEINLGHEQAFAFAQIPGANQAPKGLLKPPSALVESIAPRVTQAAAEEPGAAAAAAPAEEGGGEAAQAQPSAEAAAGEQATAETAQTTQDGETALGDLATADLTLESGGVLDTQTGTLGGASVSTPEPILSGCTPTTTDANGDCVPDQTTDAVVAGGDARVSESSLTHYGWLVRAGVGAVNSKMLGGRATDGSGGAPIITDNDLDPADSGFLTTPFLHVLKRGAAAGAVLGSEPGYGATWGNWAGTTAAPVEDHTSAADDSIYTPLPENFFWITWSPTSATTVASQTGQGVYRNVLGYGGGASSGDIDALFNTTQIDFATGVVDGELSIYTQGGEDWNVDYGGSVTANVLDLSIDTANSTVRTIDGNVHTGVDGLLALGFAGTDAGALAGIFDVYSTDGSNVDVDGAMLVDNAPVGDLRLTKAEQSAMTDAGLLTGLDGTGYFYTEAISSLSGDPVLRNRVIDASTGYGDLVFRRGTASVTDLKSLQVGSKQVVWGLWDATVVGNDVLVQRDANDPNDVSKLTGIIAWLTAQPTDAGILAGLNTIGIWSGTLPPSAFSARADNGSPVGALQFSAKVNFGTALVTNASLQASTGTDAWNVNFNDGSLINPNTGLREPGFGLQVNSATSSVVRTPNPAQSVQGMLGGIITGDAAQGIAGTFQLQSTAAGGPQLTGSFVSNCTTCP